MKLKTKSSRTRIAHEVTWRRAAVKASEALGRGFLTHPLNERLRQDLESRALTAAGVYRELLRIVYRCWFLLLAKQNAKVLEEWKAFSLTCSELGLEESPLSNASIANETWLTVTQLLGHGELDWLRLGSVYETLLELEPRVDLDERTFLLKKAARHQRKITGSYYTPGALIQSLLDATLEPVVAELIAGQSAEQAMAQLLDLKICDPACGSGHFLVAAARRLAGHVARLGQTDEHDALHSAVMNCLYGVDLNPLAVELCKIGLWLESGAASVPLSFLNQRICCGNSLLGATPALVAHGIPDEAFKPLAGDCKLIAGELKQQNRTEEIAVFAADSSVADAWCAAFVWRKDVSDLGRQCPTQRILNAIGQGSHGIGSQVCGEIERLAREHQFFHWHLAFPEVFCDRGGFDVVLGNPPYVASYSRQSAQRDTEFARTAPLMMHVLGSRQDRPRMSGRANLFLGFVWQSLHLLRPDGRAGLVVPDALLTNESYFVTRQALLSEGVVRQVCLFRNAIFPSATVGTAFVVLGRSPLVNADIVVTTVDNPPQSAEGIRSTHYVAPNSLIERPKASWHPDTVIAVHANCETIPLGDIAEVRDGINPGPSAVRERLVGTVARGDNPRRLIEGSNIQPFHLHWTGLWIDYRATQISAEERKRGTSLREAWIFDSPKIVYRQTARYPIAAVDTAGHYSLNSVHHIVLNEPHEELLWTLCAYLNSTTCRAQYQARTGETRRVFPQVHVSSIRALPVPRRLLDGFDPLTMRIGTLARQVAALSDHDPLQERTKLLQAIDLCVTELVTGHS